MLPAAGAAAIGRRHRRILGGTARVDWRVDVGIVVGEQRKRVDRRERTRQVEVIEPTIEAVSTAAEFEQRLNRKSSETSLSLGSFGRGTPDSFTLNRTSFVLKF